MYTYPFYRDRHDANDTKVLYNILCTADCRAIVKTLPLNSWRQQWCGDGGCDRGSANPIRP